MKKYKYKIIIALFFFLLTFNFNAQNYKLNVISDSKELSEIIEKKSFKKTFADSLLVISELEKIKSKLFQKGYISASFDSLVYDSLNVKAYLFIGKKYVIQNINSEYFAKKNKIKSISTQELFAKYKKIINYYENNGYPFAVINPKKVKINNNGSINIDIELKKNKKVKINKVFIKGNAKISKTFIKRYLSIFSGNLYNESIISEISNKLNNLSFVTQIRKPEIDFFGNKADVYIYINNKKANNFDGVIGFIPDKENEYKLLFTGEFNLLLVNNLKKGENFFLNWKKTKKQSQKLNIGSNIPYLFNSPFGAKIQFNLDKRDTTFMTIFEIVGLSYSLKNNDKLIAYINNKSSYILSPKNIDTTIFKDVKTLSLGMSYNTQKLNYFYNPSRGYFFLTDISSGNRNFNSIKTRHLELNVDFDFYVPVYRKFVYKLSSKNKYLFSKKVFFQNELYKVGGFNSIRGFDEEAFFTSNFSVVTNEIRFLYEKKSNIYIFSDIARIKQTKNNLLLFGFGIGTNFSTKAGIFSISYALGKIANNPMQISSSKIHLGYISQF